MAWGYCLAFAGVTMQGLDTMADALGDPNLKDQISASMAMPRRQDACCWAFRS